MIGLRFTLVNLKCLHRSPFIYFVIIGSLEFPGTFATPPLNNIIGKRKVISISCIFTAIILAAASLLIASGSTGKKKHKNNVQKVCMKCQNLSIV